MSREVRGQLTSPAAVPARWRGPLPDLSVARNLPVRDGYAEVPQSLLHSGCQDLAVLVWAQLRLWFNKEPGITTYRELATALSLDEASAGAIERRFSIALQPLLGSWIVRTRVKNNLYSYQAVRLGPKERYAMIRRCDLTMLSPDRTLRAKPKDIVDFARWQLECGPRGWTAESTTVIAKRWGVTRPTIRASRTRLAELRLLETVARDDRGPLSELVWLKEVYDPAWESLSTDNILPRIRAIPVAAAPTLGKEMHKSPGLQHIAEPPHGKERHKPEVRALHPRARSEKEKHKTTGKEQVKYAGKNRTSPIEDLSEVLLAGDLTNLGGASAPPLSLLTREVADAPPAASSRRNITWPKESAHHRTSSYAVACRLIAEQPRLVHAGRRFRGAILSRLIDALDKGLLLGHVERALQRVIDEGAFYAECKLLERALQQAWADQKAGMCQSCGLSPGDHWSSCPEVTRIDELGGVAQPRDAAGSHPQCRYLTEDALAQFLCIPDDAPADSEDADQMIDWMSGQLARTVLDAADRRESLQESWRQWRTIIAESEPAWIDRSHQLSRLDLAAATVRRALDQERRPVIASLGRETDVESLPYAEGTG